MKYDQIWALEGGIMVRFQREDDAADVAITILDCAGNQEKVLAAGTLTGWRWKRAIEAMS